MSGIRSEMKNEIKIDRNFIIVKVKLSFLKYLFSFPPTQGFNWLGISFENWKTLQSKNNLSKALFNRCTWLFAFDFVTIGKKKNKNKLCLQRRKKSQSSTRWATEISIYIPFGTSLKSGFNTLEPLEKPTVIKSSLTWNEHSSCTLNCLLYNFWFNVSWGTFFQFVAASATILFRADFYINTQSKSSSGEARLYGLSTNFHSCFVITGDEKKKKHRYGSKFQPSNIYYGFFNLHPRNYHLFIFMSTQLGVGELETLLKCTEFWIHLNFAVISFINVFFLPFPTSPNLKIMKIISSLAGVSLRGRSHDGITEATIFVFESQSFMLQHRWWN